MPSTQAAMARLAEIFQVSVEFLQYGTSGAPSAKPSSSEKILDDINVLLAELGDSTGVPPSGPDEVCESEPEGFGFSRKDLEVYFHHFLKEAERHPNGLAHVWYQLRREFPHDLFKRLRGGSDATLKKGCRDYH